MGFSNSLHIYTIRNNFNFDGCARPQLGGFFTTYFETPACESNEILASDFLLFTEDDRYLLIRASATVAQPDSPRRSNHLIQIKYILVDLEARVISSTVVCEPEKSAFEPHHVALFQSNVVILATSRQEIMVYNIGVDGKLIQINSIGKYCFPDDDLVVTSVFPRGGDERMLSSFQQRLLSFLYRRAKGSTTASTSLREFYFQYDEILALNFSRVQCMDRQHILIRMNRLSEAHAGRWELAKCLFVLYNIENSEIVAVSSNSDSAMYEIFTLFSLGFVAAQDGPSHEHLSTICTDMFARSDWNHLYSKLSLGRNGQSQYLVRRKVLSSIPLVPQSFPGSPYLNKQIFSYDDRYMLTPFCSFRNTVSIGFHLRRNGKKAFALSTKSMPETGATMRPFAHFIWHSALPLVLLIENIGSLQFVDIFTHE